MEDSIIKWTTFGLAVAGFVLGVVNYITELFRRNPRARVICRNYLDSLGRVGLAVTVVNTGESTFTVTGIAFALKGGQVLWPTGASGDELPKILHPGEQCEIVIPRGCYLHDSIAQVQHVFARIPTGKEFHSKKITRDFLGV